MAPCNAVAIALTGLYVVVIPYAATTTVRHQHNAINNNKHNSFIKFYILEYMLLPPTP